MKPHELLTVIPVEKENPKESGTYITNLGYMQYRIHSEDWRSGMSIRRPTYWLKPTGKTEEEIQAEPQKIAFAQIDKLHQELKECYDVIKRLKEREREAFEYAWDQRPDYYDKHKNKVFEDWKAKKK